MRQRAMIAMALICEPKLLIADEPTTALDVTVQAQILELIKDLRNELNSAVILITHDLGVVAETCDHVVVMYGGQCVEKGPVDELFDKPEMPYTWGLPGSMPRMDRVRQTRLTPIPGSPPSLINVPKGCVFNPRCRFSDRVDGRPLLHRAPGPAARRRRGTRCAATSIRRSGARSCSPRSARTCETRGLHVMTTAARSHCDRRRRRRPPLLEVREIRKYFPGRAGGLFGRKGNPVKAVDGVSFTVHEGETLGLVGESGCGKSTTGRGDRQADRADRADRSCTRARSIANLSPGQMRPLRREIQMIFQDPYSSLNPRHTIGTIIGSPFRIQGTKPDGGVKRTVQGLMERVGLNPEHYNRYPHEFSGGQRQRIGIARALALRPKLIVCDEPVSALDVSVQAQVVNLLEDLQHEFGLAYIFIAHDLSVVRHISDRVVVMYLGKVMEEHGPRHAVRVADAPVHARAAVRRADPGPDGGGPPRADPAHRRPAEPVEPAVGLRVPHALPEVPHPAVGLGAGPLPDRGARARGEAAGPVGLLPLRRGAHRPHRRRGRPDDRAASARRGRAPPPDVARHAVPGPVHRLWTPDHEPVLEVADGDVIEFDAQECAAGQLDDFRNGDPVPHLDYDLLYPLVGPVLVAGAEPGDAVELEVVEYRSGTWGWTSVLEDFGLLAEDFPDLHVHRWELGGTTADFQGVATVPLRPFLGVLGATPDTAEPLSPFPPGTFGGNIDTRDITNGASVLLPVQVPGARILVGDPHAAQGDGEVCGAAIEASLSGALRVKLHKGLTLPAPQFRTAGPAPRRHRGPGLLRDHGRRTRPHARVAGRRPGDDRPPRPHLRHRAARRVRARERGRGPEDQRGRRPAQLGRERLPAALRHALIPSDRTDRGPRRAPLLGPRRR